MLTIWVSADQGWCPQLDELRRRRAAGPGRGLLVGRVEEAGASAHARVGQGELHALGGFAVSGDRGDDAAYLLEAGQGEEGRRASVGLRAHDVEPRLGLLEVGRAGGPDGAAGVHVWVDLRGDARRGLQAHVEVETDLGEEG